MKCEICNEGMAFIVMYKPELVNESDKEMFMKYNRLYKGDLSA